MSTDIFDKSIKAIKLVRRHHTVRASCLYARLNAVQQSVADNNNQVDGIPTEFLYSGHCILPSERENRIISNGGMNMLTTTPEYNQSPENTEYSTSQ